MRPVYIVCFEKKEGVKSVVKHLCNRHAKFQERPHAGQAAYFAPYAIQDLRRFLNQMTWNDPAS